MTPPGTSAARNGSAPRDGRAIDGASFILDAPKGVPAIWGSGGDVAWARGETLLIAGPQGVGKTTLAQRLALARCAIDTAVLGLPVDPDPRGVLYVAADRPAQAR